MQQFAKQPQADEEKKANQHQCRAVKNCEQHGEYFVHGSAVSFAGKGYDKKPGPRRPAADNNREQAHF
ncbi:hypothetical protein ACQFN5_01765 (plasmid) [Klebsiella sp. WOUb02]|uniref:hypothetical protein n=1 Tax=Klebsiella sp. WOUb02 TaxID=3161071 RepID=UPI003CF00C22